MTGLEHATNLTSLNLGGEYVEAEGRWGNSNSISDLSLLTGLTSLTSLYLDTNTITDISPLAELINLTWLNLSHNTITDLSPVANLTHLTSLFLAGNSISDISPVAGLTNLTSLFLGDNYITDISPVAGLTNLTQLHLLINLITDISPLMGLTNLTWLDLALNNLTNISPLVENTGLGSGDQVFLNGNLLSSSSINTHIPTLQGRGVAVRFDNQTSTIGAADLNVGEPRTVRMIYFLPNDWQYRADVVQKMKDTIRTVQTFYAEQMAAHGYGNVTFRFETDLQGEPMVHHVDGQHPFSHYDNTLGNAVFEELEQTFDFNANIYFIVLGTDALRQGSGELAGGVGHRRGKNGGELVVPNGFEWDTVAHELGHTFGLNHDFRDNTYIMSYGSGPYRLSSCAAEFLSVHTYFRPDTPIEKEQPPTIELISPHTYPPGSTSVPVRVQVSDSDGLHQVLLHALGSLQLCRKLTGEKDVIVEFEYDGGFGQDGFRSFSSAITHRIRVDIVDTAGNVSDTFFTLAEISPHNFATIEGHSAAVLSVTYSPDGTILASGGIDRTVKLWDVATRQNIDTFSMHRNWVESVSFSPDEITLASGGFDGTINLWNVATRQNIATFKHENGVLSVSFSPDGETLASGSLQEIKLWDVTTRENIDTLEGHTDWVESVSFSPDEITLASGGVDKTIKLWDVATRQNIDTLEGHTGAVLSVSFSPDGTLLASGSFDKTIKLWDVATRQNIAIFKHGDWVTSVSFSPDGGASPLGR